MGVYDSITEDEEVVGNVTELLLGLWARRLLIIIIGIACGLIGLDCAAFLITPNYEATAKMYVDNIGEKTASGYISTGELSAAKDLVKTYSVIAETNDSLDAVNAYAGTEFTYEELKAMLDIAPVDETEVFEITVTYKDANVAKILTNAFTEVLPERISAAMKGSGVTTIEHAYTTGKKVSPSIARYTVLFGFLGVVVSCIVIIIIDKMDDKIHGEEYIANHFKHPVIAVIPDLFVKNVGGSKYNEK